MCRLGHFVTVCTAAVLSCGRTGLELDSPQVDPEPALCVLLADEEVEVTIDYRVELGAADVFFLIDASTSMEGEINEVVRRLRTVIMPGVRSALGDVWFGAAAFSDFRFRPEDALLSHEPFLPLSPLTDDEEALWQTVIRIPRLNGIDEPEAQVEALYQTANGDGIDPILPPADCPAGGRGYPCFRPEAVPIVVLATDAAFHDGPGGTNSYDERWSFRIWWERHRYPEAIDALRAIGARVVGIDSGNGLGGGGRDWVSNSTIDLRAVAADTGTVDADGEPLVYSVGEDGAGLGEEVVTGIETLVAETPTDVAARAEDEPGDAFDATRLVVALAPDGAEPADGVAEVRESGFVGVRPGTTVSFRIVLRGDAAPRLPTAQEYRLRIVLLGDGGVRLAERLLALRVSGTREPASCDD